MEPKDAITLLYTTLMSWFVSKTKRQAEFRQKLRTAKRKTALCRQRLVDFVFQTLDDNDRVAYRRKKLLYKLIRRESPSVWSRKQSSGWWEVVSPDLSFRQWLLYFRMSEETFAYLCNKLRPALSTYPNGVPLEKRIAIGLWKLATGADNNHIGDLFRVSVITVRRCVRELCSAAEAFLVPEQIRYPDEDKFKEISTCTEESWGLPHCIGAIGGSHIPVTPPENSYSDYLNCSECHTIILQGVVDCKGHFWNVFTGLPGSLENERVLKLSPLWELASRGNHAPAVTRNIGGVDANYYILGDSTYPLQSWLLKPFGERCLTAEQQTYNAHVGKAHDVVENAFGRLKGRWHCLSRRSDCDVDLVRSMVMTCCALHNLCEGGEEAYVGCCASLEPTEPVIATSQTSEEEGRDVQFGLMRYLTC